MKRKTKKPRSKRRSINKKLRFVLTILLIIVSILAIALVTLTIDEKKTEIEIRTVPHVVPLEKIIDGGPPKDGISSIDTPSFITVDEAASQIKDNDSVFVVHLSKGTRIFPMDILTWHQIVNDVLADPPVVVTYCPFVNHVAAYNGVYNGALLHFGVSGKLFESNMLMYDRQTNSLWQQLTGKSIVGEMTGASLSEIPSEIMPFKYASKKFTDAKVLSHNTGFDRNYDEHLYEVYLKSDKLYFEISNNDLRYSPKKIVHGVEIDGKTKAYPDELLYGKWFLQDTFSDIPLLVLKNPQTGAVKIFKTFVYGIEFDFELVENGIKDKLSGSKWNFDGECTEGKYKGWKLTPIKGTRVFWFAWATLYPDTEIFSL